MLQDSFSTTIRVQYQVPNEQMVKEGMKSLKACQLLKKQYEKNPLCWWFLQLETKEEEQQTEEDNEHRLVPYHRDTHINSYNTFLKEVYKL